MLREHKGAGISGAGGRFKSMKNYSKIEPPFERARNGKRFTLTNVIVPNHRWFLEEAVAAVEKVDGTNVGIRVENRKIVEAYNRETKITLGSDKGFDKFITEGILHALQEGWLKDGIQYGELIGPNINENRHQMKYHLWAPFDWLRETCTYDNYPRNYEALSEWFKTLPSVFNRTRGLPDILAEGVVFYREKTGAKVKIRRDMFDWYQGKQHKEISDRGDR